MNLGRCISNLLRQYPAVGVPGIGVFSIKRRPASFDQEQSVFLPPTSQIEFSAVDEGGFPLTDYLKAQRQVDEATATGMLDNAVRELFDAIHRNGQVLLDGIGYLVTEGQSLVLKPFETNDLALKPVKDRQLSVHEEIVSEAAEPIATPEETGKSGTTKWVVAASLLVLLSAVGAAWYFKPVWFEQAQEKLSGIFETEGSGQTANGDQGSAASLAIVADEAVTDSAAIDTAFSPSMVADSTSLVAVATDTSAVAKKPSVTYEIIVGSFATMKQAEKYVAEMKAKGYDLEAMDSRMPGNRKKISWGGFATEEEAYRELARVQKTFEPGAWIAKVENE